MTPTPSDEIEPRAPDAPFSGPSDPAKMAAEGANEPLPGSSMPMEAAEQPRARAESRLFRDKVGAMDMAVALEADARQAAAVKLAD